MGLTWPGDALEKTRLNPPATPAADRPGFLLQSAGALGVQCSAAGQDGTFVTCVRAFPMLGHCLCGDIGTGDINSTGD